MSKTDAVVSTTDLDIGALLAANRTEIPRCVIFDMDGTLIDSEPLWAQAEQEVFVSLGVHISADDAAHTARMTTAAVTQYWYQRYPWSGPDLDNVEQAVITRVAALIRAQGRAIPGMTELVKQLKHSGARIGLATNSPAQLIPVVLQKLGLAPHIDHWASAEHEARGKPAPDVYLRALQQLNCKANDCLAFEDSDSGAQAAQAAGIAVVRVPV